MIDSKSTCLKIAFYTCVAALLLSVSAALFLTRPTIATPFANWVLGDRVQVDRAALRFPALNTMDLDTVRVGKETTVGAATLRLNIFGAIPGIRPVSKLSMRRGVIDLTSASEPQDGNRFDPRQWVDVVNLSDITIRFEGRSGQSAARILNADASVSSGRVEAVIEAAQSQLILDGHAEGLRIQSWTGRVQVKGDNLAAIADLAGIAAPDTPPFDLDLVFDGAPQGYDITIEQSRIGDSDVRGMLMVNTQTSPVSLQADLMSYTLDFDDLGILFGVPIGIGEDETSGKAQQAARTAYKQSGRLIPNAILDVSRLDAVNADIRYEAETIVDSVFDLTGLALSVAIDGRVVRANRAELRFTEGRIEAYMTLDAEQAPPVTDVSGEMIGVDAKALALDPFVSGTLDGEFKLTGQGNGFRGFAATVTGNVTAWSLDAEIIALAAEAAGLDLVEALSLISARSAEASATYTPARCFAANIALQNGAGEFLPVVADTRDSLVTLDGGFNLKDETLDFEVKADAKDASWGALLGDITVRGAFTNPQWSAIGPEAVVQVAAAALLAGISGPLVALPFIEPGAGQDAPCGRIVSKSKASVDAP